MSTDSQTMCRGKKLCREEMEIVPNFFNPASDGTGGTFLKYLMGWAGRDFLDLFFGTNGTKNIISI
jgi:hypothetical protein